MYVRTSKIIYKMLKFSRCHCFLFILWGKEQMLATKKMGNHIRTLKIGVGKLIF